MKKSELRRIINEEIKRMISEGPDPRVNTSLYVASHGKEPKGNGQWAFQFRKGQNDTNPEMFWPKGPLPYAKALALAKAEAKTLGNISIIDAMP